MSDIAFSSWCYHVTNHLSRVGIWIIHVNSCDEFAIRVLPRLVYYQSHFSILYLAVETLQDAFRVTVDYKIGGGYSMNMCIPM